MSAVIDSHQPFKSVGLVCMCGGNAVGIEGIVTCRGCGAIYSIAVLVLFDPRTAESRAREPEAVSPTEGTES